MKRYLLLAGMVVCLLSACGAQEEPSANVPLPDPDASVQLPPPPPQERILYTLSESDREETVQTDTGVVLLTSRYGLPVLNAHRSDGSAIVEAGTEMEKAALAAVGAFNEKFTDWSDEGDQEGDLAQIAAEDYAWRSQEGIEWVGSYTTELECTAYQTQHMVSVSGLYYSYTGGAHGNSVYLAWNFDLDNGAFFGPELLGGGELQTAVTEELKRQCAQRAADYGMEPAAFFWQDYETILADWQSYAISFDEDGMSINYSPYELAAYAAGGQCFEISYEFLKPYLRLQGQHLLGLVEEPGA